MLKKKLVEVIEENKGMRKSLVEMIGENAGSVKWKKDIEVKLLVKYR